MTAPDQAEYDHARAHVLATQEGSINSVRLALGIGKDKARAIIASLEEDGVLGPPQRLGFRAVLLDRDGHPHVGIGHNAPPPTNYIPDAGKKAADDRLRLLIERIERLEEEKKGIADDIRDVFGEAKAVGYDVKTLRKVIALRKLDTSTRTEQEALLDTYKSALGMG